MKRRIANFDALEWDTVLTSDDYIQQRAAITAIVVKEPPTTPQGTFYAVHVYPKTATDGTTGYVAIVVACETACASCANPDEVGNE